MPQRASHHAAAKPAGPAPTINLYEQWLTFFLVHFDVATNTSVFEVVSIVDD